MISSGRIGYGRVYKRCKHCWIGHALNKRLSKDDQRYVAKEFAKFLEKVTVTSWYRELDYRDDNKKLWELEISLSTHPPITKGTNSKKF